MKNKHIVIATTFRDFNGSLNDEIQLRFLNGLSKQSHKNFTLVVTIFREKKVEETLVRFPIDSKIFVSELPADKKFSLTEVLCNGIDVSIDNNSSFLIWTTCDVIFEVDFLEKVCLHLGRRSMLTSHPHKSMEKKEPLSINSGFDIIGFGKNVLTKPGFREAIEKYKFYDWGLFEHFLIALGVHHKCVASNIYLKSPIFKIENDRVPGNETNTWLAKCWDINKTQLNSFLIDKKMSLMFFNLTYCHKRFMMPGFGINQVWAWRSDQINYLIFRLRRLVSEILSAPIKLVIKRFS